MTTRETKAAVTAANNGQPYGLSLDDPDGAHVRRILELKMQKTNAAMNTLDLATASVDWHVDVGTPLTVKEHAYVLEAMAELQFALSTLAASFGLPLDKAFNLLHRSKMDNTEANYEELL